MADYPEVIRVQSYFMVQLYLDATRLKDWDAYPDLFLVDSDLLFQTLTSSIHDSSTLVLLNHWAHITSELRSASRIHPHCASGLVYPTQNAYAAETPQLPSSE
jgi:hypothetical protein